MRQAVFYVLRFQRLNKSTLPNYRILPRSGEFLVSVLGKDVDVKTPSVSLGGLYPSKVRWTQEICKMP